MKTKEQMIEEAGFYAYVYKSGVVEYSSADQISDGMMIEDLDRLIVIVAEEAAKVCAAEALRLKNPADPFGSFDACAGGWAIAEQCERAIRERFKQERELG